MVPRESPDDAIPSAPGPLVTGAALSADPTSLPARRGRRSGRSAPPGGCRPERHRPPLMQTRRRCPSSRHPDFPRSVPERVAVTRLTRCMILIAHAKDRTTFDRDVLRSPDPVIVDFWTPRCAPRGFADRMPRCCPRRPEGHRRRGGPRSPASARTSPPPWPGRRADSALRREVKELSLVDIGVPLATLSEVVGDVPSLFDDEERLALDEVDGAFEVRRRSRRPHEG